MYSYRYKCGHNDLIFSFTPKIKYKRICPKCLANELRTYKISLYHSTGDPCGCVTIWRITPNKNCHVRLRNVFHLEYYIHDDKANLTKMKEKQILSHYDNWDEIKSITQYKLPNINIKMGIGIDHPNWIHAVVRDVNGCIFYVEGYWG